MPTLPERGRITMSDANPTPASGDSRGETDGETVTVETTPEQILNGLQVGLPDPRAICAACGRDLHDGTCVTVYAYRRAESSEWEIPRIYCRDRDCHPDRVRSPTLGVTEAVASAFLAVAQYAACQTARTTLSSVELRDHSPPTEGERA